MSERLTTGEMKVFCLLVEQARGEGDPDGVSGMDLDEFLDSHVKQIADELRERRALDLDDEERQVLFMMARDLGKSTAFDDHTWYVRGLALLDRLLTGAKP